MDEAMRIRIIQIATELFQINGYRYVTLSDLATKLGMSKKTLYLYFDGKEQIAAAVLENTMAAIRNKIAESTQMDGDPLHILRDTLQGVKQEIVKLNPVFLEDVQKYIPELWAHIEAFRSGQLTFIEKLLVQAQEAGVIRDVDPRVAAVLMSESVQTFLRPDFAAKHGFSTTDVAETLLVMFTEGLRIHNND
ncbi:transcriptional regulator, TetR family [Paenibacillus sp. 1_12]|uniref:TetR/AcrR family transcriptional regulator n=1 Tax=Paenibacillus sp. 1_12 TaxID=1566278 RepID=UPI0008E112C7|nr:TetR/AcrR family transcriptional regulator [Paenibacillus sp. 1_12]SFL48914.1 transcriptional regulator, TetR family [Paenibacillus sp. 1_12]